MRLIVIGRDPSQAEIILNNDYISNYHAEIIQMDNGDIFIVDKSTNGTFVNGVRLISGKETPVKMGDHITFTELGIPLDWSMIPPLTFPKNVKQLKSIGSHYMNAIVIKGGGVSRFHATIRQMTDGKWYICDHSKNGTKVNGRNIPKNQYVKLKKGDDIQCGGVSVENPIPRPKALTWVLGVVAAACVVALAVFGLSKIDGRKTLTDQEIIAMYDNSVVLMVSEYHFEVTCGTLSIEELPDPDSWNRRSQRFTRPLYDKFIISGDEISEFTGDNSILSTGTGFFIGTAGNIVTNRHVAKPWEGDKINYGASAVTIEEAAEDYFRSKLTALYEMGVSEALPYISQVEVHGVLDNMIIVPNGKYFNNHSTISCAEVISSSEEEDLSIFKILSDQMPYNVTPVPLKKIKSVEPQKGEHLLTIGFPMGLSLLDNLEKTEIQANATTGSITRNDNRYRFGIDAASRPGASGSPIFDNHGNLIGILNSGISSTQGFNFGIKATYLNSLIETSGINK